ncbi:hypothetical protein JEQ12_011829 [Ovis aries]|uniref:Uncharacterized protein n=1 Tax=Ovis aries TaxID=9940 RepID=A0A836CS24_SHEEP|nr:hypothetical protein JEQ12_011829 [Ovis aries]
MEKQASNQDPMRVMAHVDAFKSLPETTWEMKRCFPVTGKRTSTHRSEIKQEAQAEAMAGWMLLPAST